MVRRYVWMGVYDCVCMCLAVYTVIYTSNGCMSLPLPLLLLRGIIPHAVLFLRRLPVIGHFLNMPGVRLVSSLSLSLSLSPSPSPSLPSSLLNPFLLSSDRRQTSG